MPFRSVDFPYLPSPSPTRSASGSSGGPVPPPTPFPFPTLSRSPPHPSRSASGSSGSSGGPGPSSRSSRRGFSYWDLASEELLAAIGASSSAIGSSSSSVAIGASSAANGASSTAVGASSSSFVVAPAPVILGSAFGSGRSYAAALGAPGPALLAGAPALALAASAPPTLMSAAFGSADLSSFALGDGRGSLARSVANASAVSVSGGVASFLLAGAGQKGLGVATLPDAGQYTGQYTGQYSRLLDNEEPSLAALPTDPKLPSKEPTAAVPPDASLTLFPPAAGPLALKTMAVLLVATGSGSSDSEFGFSPARRPPRAPRLSSPSQHGPASTGLLAATGTTWSGTALGPALAVRSAAMPSQQVSYQGATGIACLAALRVT